MGEDLDEAEEFLHLELGDALEIYGAIIGGSPAQAVDHLRSREALSGALARPINYAHYDNADLALQGAVLAHGIAETQPFIDGNKRTALVAMLTFFELSGFTVDANDRDSPTGSSASAAGLTPPSLRAPCASGCDRSPEPPPGPLLLRFDRTIKQKQHRPPRRQTS